MKGEGETEGGETEGGEVEGGEVEGGEVEGGEEEREGERGVRELTREGVQHTNVSTFTPVGLVYCVLPVGICQ